ncbi:alpha/beta fold hydrolase [Anaeromyxobacter paludicola]|uniref:Hydrolase n=1 Tax=Anaeromyxobacter paludicola TaxID=2918171 RepID=A0ABM7XF82_9BACT|nr:alpha/beta fold hydrolase [Anaeromyxobacter paludicola]BDG10558.1 hydrolase [Anaeromyxobacter paludicola]
MFELKQRSINGHQLAYLLEGEGPTLLLVHGIAGTSATWLEAMKRLASRHRVLAPDLLGHGASDKPEGDYSLGAHAAMLRDLLGSLGIPRVTVAGHSLGGGIAMQLAYQHPEICQAMILVSSGGLGRELNAALRLLALPGAELLLPLIAPAFVRDRGNALLAWIRDQGIRSPRIHEGWQAYTSLADPESRRAFVRELRSVVGYGGQVVSASDRLPLTAGLPTLIVWGDRDPIIPLSHGRAAHEAISGSRLEIFEGAGHFPHAEFPERFAEVVAEFMEHCERRPLRAGELPAPPPA